MQIRLARCIVRTGWGLRKGQPVRHSICLGGQLEEQLWPSNSAGWVKETGAAWKQPPLTRPFPRCLRAGPAIATVQALVTAQACVVDMPHISVLGLPYSRDARSAWQRCAPSRIAPVRLRVLPTRRSCDMSLTGPCLLSHCSWSTLQKCVYTWHSISKGRQTPTAAVAKAPAAESGRHLPHSNWHCHAWQRYMDVMAHPLDRCRLLRPSTCVPPLLQLAAASPCSCFTLQLLRLQRWSKRQKDLPSDLRTCSPCLHFPCSNCG